MSKKSLSIAITDIGTGTEMADAILNFLKDAYTVQITNDRSADYVIHSCYGYDVLNYSGVRIFITGENVCPNFGISDYALAFDQLQFGDRYCWLPLIKLYTEAYEALQQPRPHAEHILAEKTDFCAYVMSSTRDSAPERIEIFNALNQYKPVNSGGKWNNNVGGPVPNKLAFQSKHKFVIACENCSYPGYLTEKFSEAAQANAIPIYWGDPSISKHFNPKSFVNVHDFDSMESMVDFVKALDQDDTRYREMLAEPWFPNGIEPQALRTESITAFLSHIFDQPLPQAYRRNLGRWGLKQERILKRMYQRPLEHAVRQLRAKWLDLYHTIKPRKNYQG